MAATCNNSRCHLRLLNPQKVSLSSTQDGYKSFCFPDESKSCPHSSSVCSQTKQEELDFMSTKDVTSVDMDFVAKSSSEKEAVYIINKLHLTTDAGFS
ncbi:hypothetical protein C5167_003716 [Papaver somniferum]|uniref:Uncharacterized protein n=1 Tax=Papaver somniferum TaxID=3469 RepID=A0A4Y7L2T2_PAPSO|nr:hypothetical protein C5167_003716 [Papaver somniferum]